MGVKGEVAYARTIAGLGWYLGWPFGKYVEGKGVLRPGKDEASIWRTDANREL
jgi:Ca2+:H+ antiporter